MLVERVIIEVSVDMIRHGFDGLKPEGEKGSLYIGERRDDYHDDAFNDTEAARLQPRAELSLDMPSSSSSG